MRNIILIFSLMMTQALWSATLKVKEPNRSYTLIYDESKIHFESYLINLSLEKSKCNHKIIERTNSALADTLKRIPKIVSKVDKGIEYQIENKKYYTPYGSRVSKLLLSIPDEVRKLKIEEKFLCEKKKTKKKSSQK